MKLKINNAILNILEAGIKSDNSDFKRIHPALVFLHYFGGSSESWRQVITQLENDFYCLALDLRGFGQSEDSEKNHQVKDYVDDLAELIAVLKLEHYALVGHSMGGKIALGFAARNPAGLESLILFAPSPPTPEPMSDEERIRLLTTYGNRVAAEETLRKITAQPLPPEIFEQAVADNLRSSENAWKAWLKIGSVEDISRNTAQVGVPTLVAAGEKDESMTAALLNSEIVQHLKKVKLVTIPESKHLLPLEAPAVVANLIREQISEII